MLLGWLPWAVRAASGAARSSASCASRQVWSLASSSTLHFSQLHAESCCNSYARNRADQPVFMHVTLGCQYLHVALGCQAQHALLYAAPGPYICSGVCACSAAEGCVTFGLQLPRGPRRWPWPCRTAPRALQSRAAGAMRCTSALRSAPWRCESSQRNFIRATGCKAHAHPSPAQAGRRAAA